VVSGWRYQTCGTNIVRRACGCPSALLLRITDIQQGQILIGGQDISRLRQSDLRSLIAYVPQDPAMFHRTLRDNIAFARPDATEAQIRQAAQAAHVTEFAGELRASRNDRV